MQLDHDIIQIAKLKPHVLLTHLSVSTEEVHTGSHKWFAFLLTYFHEETQATIKD